jgi:DNA polymerase/3'-5' exonuclease PolX
MRYQDAMPVALGILDLLRPHCERLEISGSLRRRRAEVKDIEIVAIAKPFETGLFESGLASVVNTWEKVRGDITPETRYTQRIIRSTTGAHIKLDLFLCSAQNWGLIMVYRTGSKEFNMRWLQQAKRRGYRMDQGQLWAHGRNEPVHIREEEDLFKRIGMEYVPPQQRNE